MRKLISMLLALMLFSIPAFAEAPDTLAGDYYTEPCTSTQDYYIDILLEIDTPDDNILELPLRIKAFTVTYQYDVYRDTATGYYVGFEIDPETVVTLSELPIEDSDSPNLTRFLLDCIDLKFNHLRRPDKYSFSGHGADSFEIEFVGGEFEVTYSARLFFSSYDGSLIDATQKTTNLEYTFRSPE